MQHRQRLIIAVLCALGGLVLAGCDGQNTFQSSVPRYPVSVTIDTRAGLFVHFTPEALNTYVIADKDGYHYNNQLVQRTVLDAVGYGGVIVYIDINGQYNAWDLACPYCAGRGMRRPCAIDGIYAVCPECSEKYDIGSGTAAPQTGIAREYMLRLPMSYSGGVITVRQ